MKDRTAETIFDLLFSERDKALEEAAEMAEFHYDDNGKNIAEFIRSLKGTK